MALQSQGLRQVQKQTQNLVLAPQLRQSLKILQVPALELRSAILEELQTNPLLEEVGTNDESLDGEEPELSPDENQEGEGEEFPEDPEVSNQAEHLGNNIQAGAIREEVGNGQTITTHIQPLLKLRPMLIEAI